MRERTVLHFNVADFAVAVERVVDRTLRQRPVIIAPSRAPRAVVYDMSDEAYHDGVRKGMALYQATRLCREARLLEPRTELYRRAMKGFLKEVRNYSPLVEYGQEDGHLFVDVTGTHRLWGPAPDVGLRVRHHIRDGLGLDPIWGLGVNRLVAKVATRVVKPVGECIVAPGEEASFLAPLSVSLLPGLYQREIRKLQEFHIASIGQLATLSQQQLMVPFGSRCQYLHDASRGVDRESVSAEQRAAAVVDYEHCFVTDTNDVHQIEAVLDDLVSRAGNELRRRKQVARRVGVWIHYCDGGHVVRQNSAKSGSSSDFVLQKMAQSALHRGWKRRIRLRRVRLVCDRLHRQSPQLPLFPEAGLVPKRQEKVLCALDTIRSRFGHNVIKRGHVQGENISLPVASNN
jgi:DNA polymerase IV